MVYKDAACNDREDCLVVVAAAVVTLATVLALRLARPRLVVLLGDTSSGVAFNLIQTIGDLGTWFDPNTGRMVGIERAVGGG